MTDKTRINKFIAENYDLSRRKADEYISQGRVTLNNITITEPGHLINPQTDKIRVDGELIKINTKKLYLMLNKPARVISAVTDDKHRTTVIDLINIRDKVYPIGRLDYESTGLILLTNDGEIANKLMHPKFKIYKTYQVKLSKPLDEKIKDLLTKGVVIDGKKTEPSIVKYTNEKDKRYISISIREGRNRQVRKMFERFGYFVDKLHRSDYGNLNLGKLKPGEWRKLSQKELENLIIDSK
ncbi:MAG TPA: pseudouridine synthase [Ignavibacteria bacterium]|nr:pseudouridine synthase [Ignavibacteria bacterium]